MDDLSAGQIGESGHAVTTRAHELLIRCVGSERSGRHAPVTTAPSSASVVVGSIYSKKKKKNKVTFSQLNLSGLNTCMHDSSDLRGKLICDRYLFMTFIPSV